MLCQWLAGGLPPGGRDVGRKIFPFDVLGAWMVMIERNKTCTLLNLGSEHTHKQHNNSPKA